MGKNECEIAIQILPGLRILAAATSGWWQSFLINAVLTRLEDEVLNECKRHRSTD